MSALSEGWVTTTLSEVASWGSGGTPSRSNPNYYGGGIPWLKTGELGQRYVSSTAETISEDGLKNSSAKLFPAGAVAIAMYGATIGKTSILGIDAATNQACAVGIPNTELTSKEYLYHFLCSQKDAFVEAGKGGAQPNISQTVIKEWDVPLPPLPEQKRIADKLDAVLARVDACRDRLDRIPAILKRFRQSILAAATSGNLTEDWRENGQEVGSIAEWQLLKISDLVLEQGLFSDGDWIESKDQDPEGGIRLIQLADIGDGVFLNKSRRFINDDAFARINCTELQPGDVLVARMPDPLGRACLFPDIGQRSITAVDVAILRPNNSDINNRWLVYAINAPMIRGQMELLSSGTTRQRVTRKNLGGINLRVPQIDEQTEIVRRVESLFAYADRLEVRYTATRAQVEKLTPATLAKAFRGELVPQNPNDEPAAELLKRIRAKSMKK